MEAVSLQPSVATGRRQCRWVLNSIVSRSATVAGHVPSTWVSTVLIQYSLCLPLWLLVIESHRFCSKELSWFSPLVYIFKNICLRVYFFKNICLLFTEEMTWALSNSVLWLCYLLLFKVASIKCFRAFNCCLFYFNIIVSLRLDLPVTKPDTTFSSLEMPDRISAPLLASYKKTGSKAIF